MDIFVLLFYYLFFAIPSIIFVGLVAYIKRRDVLGWVVIATISVAPIVLLVLIFMPSLRVEGSKTSENFGDLIFDGERNLQSKEYIFFLTKKYNILSDFGSNSFQVGAKFFTKIDDAINFAHLTDVSSVRVEIRPVESKGSTPLGGVYEEKADASGYAILFALICFFVAIVFIIIS
jgi:hypothetical protein